MSLWDSGPPAEEVAEKGPKDIPEERATPSLRAKVFTLAPPDCCSAIKTALSGEVPVRTFTSPSAFETEVSGKVAVAILTTAISESRLETLLKRTISAAGHARVLLIASHAGELIDEPVAHDEAFVRPVDPAEFKTLVKRLYVRAYYEVTLERLYELAVAMRNREIQLDSAETSEDDRLQRLRKSKKVMASYLEQFCGYLGPEDLRAMENRNECLEQLAADAKAGRDPSVVGLPDACPDCNLDWTEWHGSRLRKGYRKIAADSWRCTRCGSVLADPGPTDYQVR